MRDPLMRDYHVTSRRSRDSLSSTSSSNSSSSSSSSIPSQPTASSSSLPSSSSSSSSSTLNTRSTISTSESGQELWPVGVKLGIIRLGYAAGKLKYTLVDEQDIVLAREYTFEARLEVIKKNRTTGDGAIVFAYAYQTNQPQQSHQSSMILLQDLIWRRHRGPIPDRKRVIHRNHIAMDNRLDNLCLIDINHTTHVWYTTANVILSPNGGGGGSNRSRQNAHHHDHQQHSNSNNNNFNNNQSIDDIGSREPNRQAEIANSISNSSPNQRKFPANDLHLTLYWAAIQQLPSEHLQQSGAAQQANESSYDSAATAAAEAAACEVNSAAKCYDPQGNLLEGEDGNSSYFECHYAPCVRIEHAPREFSICGRCQETRYCGTVCQQLDWPHHKRSCRLKSRRSVVAPYSISFSSGSSSSRLYRQAITNYNQQQNRC